MSAQPEGRAEVLARYAEGPARLAEALAGLSPAGLDRSLSPDGWTIRQVVHHIVDGDDLWKTCIQAALGNPGGFFTLQWYWVRPQTEWASAWDYAGRPLEPALELLGANRRRMLELLQRVPDAWDRSIRIRFPERQEERITVGDVLEMQAGHLFGHIEDIRAIRSAGAI